MEQLGRMLPKVQGIRRTGSAALDLAYVAAGRQDGYWEFKLKIWGVAAGVLLIKEAGGRVTMVDGTPFKPDPVMHLASSNYHIHKEMIATLKGE